MKNILNTLLILWSVTAQSALPPTTLSGQSSSTKPTTFNFKTPYNQSTQISGIESMVETGNENMLVNPSFEAATLTGWTCTTGTCTKTTASGEFSSGKAAMKVALSAQAMNVSQTVNTVAGIQKQGYARVIYKVPSTLETFQVCSLVDGAEQTCVPSANLILDNTYRSIEIPLIFGSTSAGIKFKTSSDTGDAFFDGAIVAQGLGTQSLMLDNVYSAKITTTSGAVANLSKPSWISCTSANPTVCTFASGTFSATPTCTATIESGTASFPVVVSPSSTGVSFGTYLTTNGSPSASIPLYVICQKSGNDYLASSANVYSQSSANYDWTTKTTTLANFGTSPTITCKYRRVGGDLEGECDGATGSGTQGAGLASITLPDSLSLDTTKITNAATTGTAGQSFGIYSQTGANANGNIMTNTGTSSTLLYFSGYFSGVNNLLAQTGSTIFNASTATTFSFKVPISGWSNSSSIVGTFAGTPKVPGLDGNVDTFSVSYGTGSISNVCNASPCSYILQDGNAVYDAATSPYGVTRASAGNFALNTKKTYTYLTCQLSGWVPGVGGAVVGPIACTNCNSVAFNTRDNTWASADTYGTLTCKGKY